MRRLFLIYECVLCFVALVIPTTVAFTCTSNTIPSDFYTSSFVPCEVTFFQSDLVESNTALTSCAALTNVVARRNQTLTMWPDRCVGDEKRCYDIHNPNEAINASIVYGALNDLPEGSTHFMINCSADKAAATAFVGDLADTFTFAAEGLLAIAVVLTILCCTACVCCCIMVCGANRRSSTRAPPPVVSAEASVYEPVVQGVELQKMTFA